MAFNGIKGITDMPGELPWELVFGYYVIAPIAVYLIARKNKVVKPFKTLDFVYIGIGAAFATVWEFYVGSVIGRVMPSGLSAFVDPGFWGRMLILTLVVAVVRKFGAGMLSLLVFDVLADIFHYGFGGQPMYFIYESLTYGLSLDALIAVTKGKAFETQWKAALSGALVSLTWALPEPLIYAAFYRPFIYGAVVNWGRIYYDLWTGIALIWVDGLIAGLMAYRLSRAVSVA
jgi:hypothetical protein